MLRYACCRCSLNDRSAGGFLGAAVHTLCGAISMRWLTDIPCIEDQLAPLLLLLLLLSAR
jgi:hypothetical protein